MSPEAEVIEFDVVDVITTSVEDDEKNWTGENANDDTDWTGWH